MVSILASSAGLYTTLDDRHSDEWAKCVALYERQESVRFVSYVMVASLGKEE